MAVMSTVLTEFATQGNSRTSTYGGHTATSPKLVVEKRKVPNGKQVMVEYSFKVIEAATDASGLVLPNRVSFEGVVRYPVAAQASEIAAARAIFRDIVGGDEWVNSTITQEWL